MPDTVKYAFMAHLCRASFIVQQWMAVYLALYGAFSSD